MMRSRAQTMRNALDWAWGAGGLLLEGAAPTPPPEAERLITPTREEPESYMIYDV